MGREEVLVPKVVGHSPQRGPVMEGRVRVGRRKSDEVARARSKVTVGEW